MTPRRPTVEQPPIKTTNWPAVGSVALGFVLAVIAGVGGWYTLRTDVDHVIIGSAKAEKRADKTDARIEGVQMLQVADGRDIAALQAAVRSVVKSIDSLTKEIRDERKERSRANRWARPRPRGPTEGGR